MQETKSFSGTNLEADAENILRTITPILDPTRHKGQAGKIAVIGGCREYTGAPYFAAISALKIGADLSHVFCTKDAAPVIKSYSPELIVHPVLEESYSIGDGDRKYLSGKVVAEVGKWMERFDCLIVGPGLGRDPFLLDCVSEIMKQARQANIPIVVDGDGLFLVTSSLDLVSDYPLAVLTPNVNEYKRLVQKVLNCEVNDQDAHRQLLSLAKRIGGVTILRKGKSDLVSDGQIVKSVSIYGSPRRCGGQGDILSGSVAVFVSWAGHAEGNLSISSAINPTLLGCIAGSALLRKAASLAFENKKRSTLTSDIIECLFGGYMSSLLMLLYWHRFYVTLFSKSSSTSLLVGFLYFYSHIMHNMAVIVQAQRLHQFYSPVGTSPPCNQITASLRSETQSSGL